MTATNDGNYDAPDATPKDTPADARAAATTDNQKNEPSVYYPPTAVVPAAELVDDTPARNDDSGSGESSPPLS